VLSGGRQSPLIRMSDLTKTYVQGRWWESRVAVKALDGASLILDQGRTVALVGRSGSGKTTFAMCAALLEAPDSGRIWFNGRDTQSLTKSERALLRPRIQVCFQDSNALPARYTARNIIEEPLRVQNRYSSRERADFVFELMERVGLPAKWGERFPHQFSGGQRQRLAIARALVLNPDIVILDEPFVGLDFAIRRQIVNLLLELQAAHSLTYLFISHDMELAQHFSDSVAVMDRGQIVEQCSASDLRYVQGKE
jgi:ABC-type glutathione transport system ATPase component